MELFAGHLPPIHLVWIPVAYLGTERAIAGRTKWGRRVDVGGGIVVGILSRDVSAWIPAFAGMTSSGGPELWLVTANWHRGFRHAPPPPQRGTSPSPREVFDRTTFPSPHPSGFRPSPE